MKKLYAKQKILKITDQYPILDEDGKEVYFVSQDFTIIGGRFHVYNENRDHLFVIEKKPLSFLPEYKVTFDNGLVAILKKDFALFKLSMEITVGEEDWHVTGNLLKRNFKIYRDYSVIGEVKSKFPRIRDSFEMIIYEEESQDIIVAIMIAIDSIIDMAEKSN